MFPTGYPRPRMISISERTLLALQAIVTFSVTACSHGLVDATEVNCQDIKAENSLDSAAVQWPAAAHSKTLR